MEVAPVPFKQLSTNRDAMSSEILRQQVIRARMVQKKRFAGIPSVNCNARMLPGMRDVHCVLDRVGNKIIHLATEQLGLSVRAYDRILKVARTIADLEECVHIHPSHVAEAVNYRNLDREGWSG